MRRNPRHILRGFNGVTPTTEPETITGLTGKRISFLCRVVGMRFYKVDGRFVRTQWADFLGGHPLAYRFIPQGEIWLDGSIKEWLGYIGSHELLELLLMHIHGWKYERAHTAANALEQELRGAAERQLSMSKIYDIWLYHLQRHFPHGKDVTAIAQEIARQLWRHV